MNVIKIYNFDQSLPTSSNAMPYSIKYRCAEVEVLDPRKSEQMFGFSDWFTLSVSDWAKTKLYEKFTFGGCRGMIFQLR